MAGAGILDRPIETLDEVARELRRCLETSPPDRHEALRWVAQFMDEFERAAPRGRRAVMVAVEPGSTGDSRWDAMLAAAAEHLCYHHGLPVPSWSVDPARFIERWWFVSPYRGMTPATVLFEQPGLAVRARIGVPISPTVTARPSSAA